MVYNDDTNAKDRREFFRLNFTTPLEFKSYSLTKTAPKSQISQPSSKAVSQNISQSGILFQTGENPPQLSSILWMHLDFRTLNICQEIEKRALIFNNGVLGKVVRVEEDPENNRLYDIGVCFLTQDQRHSKEISKLLSELSQA